MTGITDFLDLCIEPGLLHINLVDNDTCTGLWEGFADEIPTQYESYVVVSFDLPASESLTLNVIEPFLSH